MLMNYFRTLTETLSTFTPNQTPAHQAQEPVLIKVGRQNSGHLEVLTGPAPPDLYLCGRQGPPACQTAGQAVWKSLIVNVSVLLMLTMILTAARAVLLPTVLAPNIITIMAVIIQLHQETVLALKIVLLEVILALTG
jgi:hypothetical protein